MLYIHDTWPYLTVHHDNIDYFLIVIINQMSLKLMGCRILITSSNGNIFHVIGPLWGESTGDQFPSQRPVAWSFNVFFDLRQNKQLSKESRCRWFEMPSHLLWRHCNDWFITTGDNEGSVWCGLHILYSLQVNVSETCSWNGFANYFENWQLLTLVKDIWSFCTKSHI